MFLGSAAEPLRQGRSSGFWKYFYASLFNMCYNLFLPSHVVFLAHSLDSSGRTVPRVNSGTGRLGCAWAVATSCMLQRKSRRCLWCIIQIIAWSSEVVDRFSTPLISRDDTMGPQKRTHKQTHLKPDIFCISDLLRIYTSSKRLDSRFFEESASIGPFVSLLLFHRCKWHFHLLGGGAQWSPSTPRQAWGLAALGRLQKALHHFSSSFDGRRDIFLGKLFPPEKAVDVPNLTKFPNQNQIPKLTDPAAGFPGGGFSTPCWRAKNFASDDYFWPCGRFRSLRTCFFVTVDIDIWWYSSYTAFLKSSLWHFSNFTWYVHAVRWFCGSIRDTWTHQYYSAQPMLRDYWI